jgi:hypothetical protein
MTNVEAIRELVVNPFFHKAFAAAPFAARDIIMVVLAWFDFILL